MGEKGVVGWPKQRIAISIFDAPILILDEATSVDNETEMAVQSALQHLLKKNHGHHSKDTG